jgi:hypothetical protein
MPNTDTLVKPMAETLSRLSDEVAKILNVDSVSPDITLLDLGIDSLTAVELTLVCDQIYSGVNREELVLTKDTTLRDLDRQMLSAA